MMLDIFTHQATHTQILAQTAFFAGLSEKQLRLVASVSDMEECPIGHQLYKIGEVANTLYVLNDGMVRFAISFGKRDAPAGDILHRGQVFGWAALTPTSNVRIATATCLTQCSVIAIDGKSLLLLMEQDHTLGYRITTQLNVLVTGTMTAFVGG